MSLPTKSINKGRGRGKLSARGRGGIIKKGASGSFGSFCGHNSSLLLENDISNSVKSQNKVLVNSLIFGNASKDLLNDSRISEVSKIKSDYHSNSSESLNLGEKRKSRSSRSASINREQNIFASDKKE